MGINEGFYYFELKSVLLLPADARIYKAVLEIPCASVEGDNVASMFPEKRRPPASVLVSLKLEDYFSGNGKRAGRFFSSIGFRDGEDLSGIIEALPIHGLLYLEQAPGGLLVNDYVPREEEKRIHLIKNKNQSGNDHARAFSILREFGEIKS